MPGPSKHSVTLAGHRTSITLEDEFWQALKKIAKTEDRSLGQLVGEIDRARLNDGALDHNLSSALRVYILKWYQAKTS